MKTPMWLTLMEKRGNPFDLTGVGPLELTLTGPMQAFLNLESRYGIPEALRQLLPRALEPDDVARCQEIFTLWAHGRVLDSDRTYLVQLALDSRRE